MALITEDLIEDVFNYIDPNYLKRLFSCERAADPSEGKWPDFLLSNSARNGPPHLAEFTYERPEEAFVTWYQPKYSALTAWRTVPLAPRTATEEALVGSPSRLATILAQINNLAFEDEQDQFGPIRPTYDALKNCLRWVLELAAEGRLLEPSDITIDHNGDIRVGWTKGNREAELVSPSDGRCYLYFSSKEAYGSDLELSTDKISERVRWALEG